MISDTVARAVAHVHEVQQHRADGGRERGQPHADARDDAERSLGADDRAAQVVAGRLRPLAPEALDGAVRHHHVQREHVRRRDAVRQAVRAAGVRVHVAADRRRLLRRRVGGVGEPERAERGRQVEVGQAGLDPREPVLGPDLDDVVHLGGDDHQRRRRSAWRRRPDPCRCRAARSATRARPRSARTRRCRRSIAGTRRARSRPRPSRRRARRASARADRRAPRRVRARPRAHGVLPSHVGHGGRVGACAMVTWQAFEDREPASSRRSAGNGSIGGCRSSRRSAATAVRACIR